MSIYLALHHTINATRKKEVFLKEITVFVINYLNSFFCFY